MQRQHHRFNRRCFIQNASNWKVSFVVLAEIVVPSGAAVFWEKSTKRFIWSLQIHIARKRLRSFGQLRRRLLQRLLWHPAWWFKRFIKVLFRCVLLVTYYILLLTIKYWIVLNRSFRYAVRCIKSTFLRSISECIDIQIGRIQPSSRQASKFHHCRANHGRTNRSKCSIPKQCDHPRIAWIQWGDSSIQQHGFANILGWICKFWIISYF